MVKLFSKVKNMLVSKIHSQRWLLVKLQKNYCIILKSHSKVKKIILVIFWNWAAHITLSEREFHGLQYLAGYVVSNLMKKVKNDKNYSSVENQNILSILDASITKDISNQKLIRSVTRGGFSAVNNQCINIFLIAEKHFRR